MASRDGPSDTMRERADDSSLKLWLVMDADRRLVAAGLVLGIFLLILGMGLLAPAPAQAMLTAADPIETLFQGLLTAIITGVTLVVTLNQLVLSQELGTAGDQRDRMEAAMTFRQDAADVMDEPVSPMTPSAFLQQLITTVRDEADGLRDALPDDGSWDSIREYTDSITDNADQVSQELEDAQFGSFTVLSAVLNFNYSWKLAEGRRLRAAEDLPADVDDRFEALEEALTLFGPAREHFKTLYFQWDLVTLSRAMLYAAVPALAVAAGMVLYFDPSAISGTTVGISDRLVIIAAGTAIALVPFSLLLSYILRIATVAKRTLSIGPFVLREEDA